MKSIALILSVAFALSMTLCAALAAGPAADGKALYVKCAGCHGADGSKTALGNKSLKGQKAEALVKELSGYKAKTYGGAKKSTMENLVGSLSEADIKALADYISKL